MQKPTHPRTAVIIPTCRAEEDLLRCLESVRKSADGPAAVFVVDNQAPPGAIAALRRAHPGTEVLHAGRDLGFAGACNLGLAEAMRRGFDFYLILNDDTVVDPGMIGTLAAFLLESDRVGMRLAGPVLERRRLDELPSEGVVPGALQVSPNGLPTLFLTDHPVTGGYPVIAVVLSADLGRAAQARPGQFLRFVEVPVPDLG